MKRLIAIILVCILTTAGCASESSTGNKALDGELELESDQSLIVAQVTAIYGNEVTLALATEVDDSQMKNQTNDQSEDSSSQGDQSESENQTNDANSQSTEASSSDTQSGEASSSDNQSTQGQSSGAPSGDMPSGDMPSGDMPSGGDMPERGENSDNTDSSDSSDNESQTQVTRYSLTGEETTMMIPVGTPVTTLLGTVTTFSRIAVDNTLKIVTEKNEDGEDTIVAIYIVG